MDTLIEFEKMARHDFKLMKEGHMPARLSFVISFVIFIVAIIAGIQVFSYLMRIFHQGFILSIGLAFLSFFITNILLGLLAGLLLNKKQTL